MNIKLWKHKEAYCLMKYVSEADGRVEWLWNSRDGVTPFIIMDNIGCANGLRGPLGGKPIMQHDDWHEDVFVPNFVPPAGMRIFVDEEKDGLGYLHPSVVIVDAALELKFNEIARTSPMRWNGAAFLRERSA